MISVHMNGHGDMHHLTKHVASIISFPGIQTGTVDVFNVGSTAAIGTIEFEPGLPRDLAAKSFIWNATCAGATAQSL